ncbi:HAD family phosphatase [Luteolibacter ambystomatis]|uniref:HAD family phosphatase n=1 Tax=Luteolibacter ambystomatis TaxID=2824561 RepID=A0A975J209_9BACT|nr:HAD family phosphatase [Luteolibacter ambystomatis]QUE52532.1 HAD family phosphatase [Luteolibacter ambystomatis]
MTFLFDIGRVLLDFEYERSLEKLLPVDCEDRRGRLERLLERKDDFEAGKIPEDEFIDWSLERLESEATPDEFRSVWRSIFVPNAPMWQVVERLAEEGHRLILFSNINSIHWPWITEAFPRFSRFHGAVLSFEVGAIKADPVIYQHAIEAHGLVPEQTRYIDDLPANIAAGRKAGLRSWQYDLKDHAAFEQWLEAELAEG